MFFSKQSIMAEQNNIKLNELPTGMSATVCTIDDSIPQNRLRELGLIEGTHITSLFSAFCGGLCAYYIRGAVIALRDDITKSIVVKMQNPV